MGKTRRPELKRAISDLDAHVRSEVEEPEITLDSSLAPSASRSLVPVAPARIAAPLDEAIYGELSLASRVSLLAIEERLDKIDELTFIAKGRELRAAKALLREKEGHGRWEAWLKRRKLAPTTARVHIRSADWADESAIIAVLPAAVVYRAAGAADEVKREIERRAAAAITVSLDDVVSLIGDDRKARALNPDQLEAQRLKEQRRKKRAERAQKKLEEEYAKAEAARLLVADKLVTMLRRVFDDGSIEELLSLWRKVTIIDIRQAFAAQRNISSSFMATDGDA